LPERQCSTAHPATEPFCATQVVTSRNGTLIETPTDTNGELLD
jgi:hypothetical protein